MGVAINISKVFLMPILVVSLALSGCSSSPWSSSADDEDLFFEEDFGSEFEKNPEKKVEKKAAVKQGKEDDFFNDDPQIAQSQPIAKPQPESSPKLSDDEDFFYEEPQVAASPAPAPQPVPQSAQPAEKISQESGVIGGGFVSVDQTTDKNEFKTEVAALHTQQAELMFRVQELQKIVSNLEPRLTATQERVESSLLSGTQSPRVQEEIRSLRNEITHLKNEIASLKKSPAPSKQAKMIRKIRPLKRFKKATNTTKQYDRALASYRAGKYDESILRFQELSLKNPRHDLKDNILFWMGNNYLKLDMYDEAIRHFQAVVKKYPKSNKVHDSRYMLGVCYQKKGDTGRALDALEVALKSNPPSAVRQKIEKQMMEIK